MIFGQPPSYLYLCDHLLSVASFALYKYHVIIVSNVEFFSFSSSIQLEHLRKKSEKKKEKDNGHLAIYNGSNITCTNTG
mgnify:CR=1 FL=1